MLRFKHWGLPSWSSGWESMLPMQGVRVWSLVGELRSRKPGGVARKEKKKKKNTKINVQKFLDKNKRKFLREKKGFKHGRQCSFLPQPTINLLNKTTYSTQQHFGICSVSNLQLKECIM